MPKFRLILSLLLASFILQGCATAVITGVATGASLIHDRRSTGSVIDDQGIEFKASSALYQDKEIYDQSHINVTSYNGQVLLTGETASEALKQQITSTIKSLNKVTRVYNEVIIAAPSSLPSRSSDAWITSKIKVKLTTAEGVDPLYIKVVTEHGVVYLMGLVSRAEANAAVAVVTQAAGVQRVIKIFQYTD